MRPIAAAAAFLLLALASPNRQGAGQPLKVRVVRFYEPANGTTTIEGVAEVRLDSLFRGGASAVARYRVVVAVSDSSGLQLQNSMWTRSLPPGVAGVQGATTEETFGFDAAPGRYRVEVRIVPSGGDSLVSVTEVQSYRTRPAISDLLLATGVRRPQTDSEPPQPGEVRRAGLMMRTGVPPRLTPTNATLVWYAEAYAQAAVDSAQMVAAIVGADGHQVIATVPRAVSFPAGGGLTRGSLDLSGLPPGQYRLRLSVREGDSTLDAEAPFVMAPAESVARVDSAQQAVPAGGDIFAVASEDQLDSLEAPLVYVARNPGGLGLYRTLTVEGKRRFLRQFWATSSMRVQGTVGREDFYRLVAAANRLFHESGVAQLAGWNTDRGRIFIRNGQWDERLNRPASQPFPYDVWRYTRGQLRWYVFGDRTGLGNYVLMATNDTHEEGVAEADWQAQLGTDATRDIDQFLGVQDQIN